VVVLGFVWANQVLENVALKLAVHDQFSPWANRQAYGVNTPLLQGREPVKFKLRIADRGSRIACKPAPERPVGTGV
jgi:hypothetical protein